MMWDKTYRHCRKPFAMPQFCQGLKSLVQVDGIEDTTIILHKKTSVFKCNKYLEALFPR